MSQEVPNIILLLAAEDRSDTSHFITVTSGNKTNSDGLMIYIYTHTHTYILYIFVIISTLICQNQRIAQTKFSILNQIAQHKDKACIHLIQQSRLVSNETKEQEFNMDTCL